MSTASGIALGPTSDSWVATISAGEFSKPLGSGFLVDERRVLTCAHVACPDGVKHGDLWVGFPKSMGLMSRRFRVREVVVPEGWPLDETQDVAMLVLEDTVSTEMPVRVRDPPPGSLKGSRWWAFGFPDGALGDSSDGIVGESLAHGWVRLDTESRSPVRSGYSGAALWSPLYEAVIGIVVQASGSTGDARGLTIWQVARMLPNEHLALLASWSVEAAGEEALSAWGWSLEQDPEARRHWRPRARGVGSDAERGYRFHGRHAALTDVISWISGSVERRGVLVVTGSPGVGKSAVLGRIVTTADEAIAEQLPATDTAVRAQTGSVACAVHAKGKSAMEVAEAIARAVSAPMPEQIGDLAASVCEVISQRARGNFTVILDALDEAESPEQARLIITKIVLPLAEACGSQGVRVVVGTRRRDDAGDLIAHFGVAAQIVDLDAPEYFVQDDLADYVRATLRLAGDERPDNPYTEESVADPVAVRIAELSEGNFLVAGLVARTHGMHDKSPVNPRELAFTASVATALGAYLALLRDVGQATAAQALTALAFAESPGFDLRLWSGAIEALYGVAPSEAQLRVFARSSAANFLVESDGEGSSGAFRLFHQSLDDALLKARSDTVPSVVDERTIARKLHHDAHVQGWPAAPAYTLRSLTHHAVRGGILDEVLSDGTYSLYADLRRLIPAAATATTPLGRQCARILRRTPRAIDASPGHRAAMFSVTEACEHVAATACPSDLHVPYRALWTNAEPWGAEETLLAGHTSEITALCAVRTAGDDMLASADFDGTLRVWNPGTGEQIHALADGHRDAIGAMCTVRVDGRELIAAGDEDGTVQLWDPVTGRLVDGVVGSWFTGLCTVRVGAHELLAFGCDDGSMRLWNPAGAQRMQKYAGRTEVIRSMCTVDVGGVDHLAVGDDDGVVRLWDPHAGQLVRKIAAHTEAVHEMCAVRVHGQELLATSGNDGYTVRLWDPRAGHQVRELTGHNAEVQAMCRVSNDGTELLAIGTVTGRVLLWDAGDTRPPRELTGHAGAVHALCAVRVDGRERLISGGEDLALRIWDPSSTEQPVPKAIGRRRVRAVSAVEVDGEQLLASDGERGVLKIWKPGTGAPVRMLSGKLGKIASLCMIQSGGRELLASGDSNGLLCLWDPVSGRTISEMESKFNGIDALCVIDVDGRDLLVCGGQSEDGWPDLELWDPVTGNQVREFTEYANPDSDYVLEAKTLCAVPLDGHLMVAAGGVGDAVVELWDPRLGKQVGALNRDANSTHALCAVEVDGIQLLASGDDYGVVCLWNPVTGAQVRELERHENTILTMCTARFGGHVLLASGSYDRSVMLWDLSSSNPWLEIPVPEPVFAITQVGDLLIIGLASGLLALAITSDSPIA